MKSKVITKNRQLEFDFNSNVNLGIISTKKKPKIVSINHLEQREQKEILRYILKNSKSF